MIRSQWHQTNCRKLNTVSDFCLSPQCGQATAAESGYIMRPLQPGDQNDFYKQKLGVQLWGFMGTSTQMNKCNPLLIAYCIV